ncbi:MAG: hypothetical protein F6K54_17850 [Okeania sp. SIO3B5]|uniref:hypothetical protein n=1 Tax=Okeania sp. SIO3B5 TaxID=2607811 RepID=UPI0013FF3382|nr:hypothetical protein [Okeania sp. SIO3B5]NEO54780.1 hypothetical protein [Okeania sp. SIO3B5]
MSKIKFLIIAFVSFLVVVGQIILNKTFSIFLCGLLSFNSVGCYANFNNSAQATLSPTNTEITRVSTTIGQIPRARKPNINLDLQQALPQDFLITTQMPFSSGKREISLISPSTKAQQIYTINLPNASFQLYGIKFQNLAAIDESKLTEKNRIVLDRAKPENLNNFQVEFQNNKLSKVVLTDGNQGEFTDTQAIIKSPDGQIIETIDFPQANLTKETLIATTQPMLLTSSNCNQNVSSKLGNIADIVGGKGNKLSSSETQITRNIGLALAATSAGLKNNINSRQSLSIASCERAVQCNEKRVSGASEIRSDLFEIPRGANRKVSLEYEFFDIPDTIELYLDGKTIYSDGPKSERHQETFTLPNNAEYVGVKLIGNQNPKTRWWYVISCSESAIANVPCGDDEIQVSYDEKSENYHFYPVKNEVCSLKTKGCNVDFVFRVMISNKQFIAPDHESQEKVEHCQTTDLDILGPWDIDTIRTTINQDKYYITNYTRKNHVLHPGKIARRIFEENGKIYVLTLGEGTGKHPTLNEWLSGYVWGKVDKKLIEKVNDMLSRKIYSLPE